MRAVTYNVAVIAGVVSNLARITLVFGIQAVDDSGDNDDERGDRGTPRQPVSMAMEKSSDAGP